MAYLWGMVFASHITAMLGAMADWDRLTYGSFPFLLLMFAIALRYFISYVRTIDLTQNIAPQQYCLLLLSDKNWKRHKRIAQSQI